jgi:hypothetical protein
VGRGTGGSRDGGRQETAMAHARGPHNEHAGVHFVGLMCAPLLGDTGHREERGEVNMDVCVGGFKHIPVSWQQRERK